MVSFESLPTDILLKIVHDLDQREKLNLAVASKRISSVCLRDIWTIPTCTNKTLLLLLNTIRQETLTTMYKYSDWLTGLHLDTTEIPPLNDFTFRLSIHTLKISNAIKGDFMGFYRLFLPLGQPILRKLELVNCSVNMIDNLSSYLYQFQSTSIRSLSLRYCYVNDLLLEKLIQLMPCLTYFDSTGSGHHLSDVSFVAISKYCPSIQTIIATLPDHLIQSNTITMVSLISLSQCHSLTRFICKGQVRISNKESKQWLFDHCPNLAYCDLSF